MDGGDRLAALPFRHLDPGDPTGTGGDAGVARDKAGNPPVTPLGLGFSVMDKALPLKKPVRIGRAVRQFHFMVDGRHMLGRNTDFQNLDIVRGKQNPVADFRRLDHAISRMKPELRPLVLIDEVHPSGEAEDQLEADRVVMHHVGHRPAVGNADMAGDDRPAEPVGDQVAVMHAGPPDHPGGLVGKAADDVVVPGRRGDHFGIAPVDLDPHAVRGDKLALAVGNQRRVLDQEAQRGNRHIASKARIKPDPYPVAGQHRHCRIIRRENLVEAEAQPLGEEGHVLANADRRNEDFRPCAGKWIVETIHPVSR